MYKMRVSLFLFTLGIVSATQVACNSLLNELLLEAAQEGDCAKVETLLWKGASVNAKDEYGATALHYADNERVVERLLRAGANIDAVDSDGDTALNYASVEGNERIVGLLLRASADVHKVNSIGHVAIHEAVDGDNEQVVNQLLQAGADVDVTNVFGNSAIHKVKSRSVCRCLVQAGADFEVLNEDKESPLVRHAKHFSRIINPKEVIGYLISIGAGIDALLNSNKLRKYLRPHVDALRDQAELLRNLLDKKHGVYADLQGLIEQHAGFPISKKAVDKMEAILLRDPYR